MNRNLPEELDFRREVSNMEQARVFLGDLIASGDVAIPQPDKSRSSQRVLTMSFEDGCYVTKLKHHPTLHLDKVQVSRLISTIFCEQIFRHGFVHCGEQPQCIFQHSPRLVLTLVAIMHTDPHEANILVRDHPVHPNRAQVVLLDHGLYRRLGDGFRREYCRLWQSIILSDQKGIEKYCQSMNAGPAFPLLTAMLTLRPWDDIISANIDRPQGDRSGAEIVMLRTYAKQYFRQIVELLGAVPSDLLLVFKTNDCLRHIDLTLGTPINSTAVVAAVASDVVLQEEMEEAISQQNRWDMLSKMCLAAFTWCRVRTRVSFLHCLRWILGWEVYINSTLTYAYQIIFQEPQLQRHQLLSD
jgi:aarF domain-containing kinase